MKIIDQNASALSENIIFLICLIIITIAFGSLILTYNYFVINENITINFAIRFGLGIAIVITATWGIASICFNYLDNQIESSFEQNKVTAKIDDVNFISSLNQHGVINLKLKDKKLPDANYIQASPPTKLNKIFKNSEITYIYNPEYKIIRVLDIK